MLMYALASMLAVGLVASLLTVIGIPNGLGTRVYWLFWSRQYKRSVLSSPPSGGLRHVEWNGDGWGGAPVGDWMGYLVYDPSDSLPLTDATKPPIKVSERSHQSPTDFFRFNRVIPGKFRHCRWDKTIL